VVVVGWNDSTATITSVKDTNGNNYALAVGPTVQSSTATQAIYYSQNIGSAAAGANTVTVNFSVPARYVDIRIAEYSGVRLTNALDTSVAAQGNSSTSDGGPLTTFGPNELLVSANLVQSMTNGSGSGFTNRIITSPDSDILEDRVALSAGSYDGKAALNANQLWIMQTVAFHGLNAVPYSSTVTTTYQYDGLNRLTQKSYSDGTTPTATLGYDNPSYPNAIGHMTSASVPSSVGGSISTLFYNFDPMGRVTAQTQYTPSGGNYWIPYTYDLVGNMTSQTYPFENGLTYTYNSAGRLTAATAGFSDANNPANLLSAVHYGAAGQITSDTLGDGETETWSYDKRLRQQSYTASYNNAPIYSWNITSFAPNGDVLAANDTANGNWNYSYDQFNRLVCATTSGTCATPPAGTPSYTYVYDRFGNRWQQNGSRAMQLTFTGNNPGNPQNNNRMDGYSYDAAGNLLNDGLHQYSYDAENRVIAVDGGRTAVYLYDAFGRRVYRTGYYSPNCHPNGKATSLYDLAGHMIVDNEGGPTGTACYIEMYVGERHLANQGGGTNFSHSDWLGTERVRTGYNSGHAFWYVCESIASLPFGDGMTTTGACYQSSPLHFTGKPHDFETGLDYFGARYDSSSFGRFISPDWSAKPQGVPYAVFNDPQSLNLYAYVRNNPLNNTDVYGHWCVFGVGSTCNQPPPPPPPPANANKTVANFHRYGQVMAAAGAVGNAVQTVKDSSEIVGSVQVGNEQLDTHGESTTVVGPPAVTGAVTVTVGKPSPDQTVLAQPGVALGPVVQVSRNVVQEKSGDVHAQGGSLTLQLSTPTPKQLPVSVGVPNG